jgi:putative restriction endonuclease
MVVGSASACAICRFKELSCSTRRHRRDNQPAGEPLVSNRLSLCSIHHRAFDQHRVGISPDYGVHVSRALLDDEDGPMLELLKTFHGGAIVLPSTVAARPDRNQLAIRFERFSAA